MVKITRCLVFISCISILELFSMQKSLIANALSNIPGDVKEDPSILDFKASYNGSFTLLEWRTEKDIQIDHFTIEVSHDEENYEAIAEIKTNKGLQNFKNYTFIDNDNLLRDSFYRLKQVDENGIITYSQVVMVKVNPLIQLRLFPIPTKNLLNIKGFLGDSDDLDVKITDLNGNSYRVYNLIKIAEDHYTIDFTSFNPNTYFVKVSCNGKSASYRVLKL